MTRKIRVIQSSLSKKGFQPDGSKSHHVYFRFFLNGLRTDIYTYFSHGADEAGDWLLKQMAKQVKLDRSQFLELVDCGMDYERYAQLLLEGGHVRQSD